MNQAILWPLSSLVWAWAYTLGYNQMGGQANINAALACLALGVALALFGKGLLDFGNTVVWIVLLLVMPLNIATAFDQQDTALRWGIFLLLYKVACAFCGNSPREFYRGVTLWLPPALAVVMLADLYARRLGTGLYDDSAKGAGHAITLYATLLAALAPFGRRFRWTVLIWLFCTGFIYLSGSRGALLSLLPILFLSVFYYGATGRRAYATLIFIGLGAALLATPAILEIFGQMKLAATSKRNALESLGASLETRLQLARNAWDLVMQEPLVGWGNGQSYNRVQGLYESVSVHSVWVVTLLQFGIPIGLAINLYVLLVPFRTLTSPHMPVELRWLVATVFAAYFFRATFESVSLFDLGSLWSFAHLVFFAYTVNLLSRCPTAFTGREGRLSDA